MNHKLTIYNNKVYKELILTEGMKTITVGTGKDNGVCFFGEDFESDFVIEIIRQQGEYIVSSSFDVFFNTDSVKEKVHVLKNGESIEVCDGKTERVFLYLDFSEDFGDKQDNYNLRIDIDGRNEISIGGIGDCDIEILSDSLAGDMIVLSKTSRESSERCSLN